MAFVHKVSPGEPVRRDRTQENAVRELVTPGMGFGERPFAARAEECWYVSGYNVSGDTTLPRGRPVVLSASAALSGDDYVPFAPVTTETADGFGILLDRLGPKEYGRAAVAGAVWTDLTGAGAAAGDYVVPVPNASAAWWQKADAGAKVLWLSANGVGLVLLGGTGGGGGKYNGYFKAVFEKVTQGNQTVKRVRIVNGASPDNEVCGHTDIGNVNAATLTYSANASIYLVAQYVNKAFSFSFSTTKPSNDALNTGYVEIAKMLTGDKVQQVWTGGMIYFGERYFV